MGVFLFFKEIFFIFFVCVFLWSHVFFFFFRIFVIFVRCCMPNWRIMKSWVFNLQLGNLVLHVGLRFLVGNWRVRHSSCFKFSFFHTFLLVSELQEIYCLSFKIIYIELIRFLKGSVKASRNLLFIFIFSPLSLLLSKLWYLNDILM